MNRTFSSRRLTAGLGVIALSFALCACGLAAPNASTGRSNSQVKQHHYEEHVQAKDEIETLYQKTTALVGTEGWGQSLYEWRGCGRSALANTDSWSRFVQWHGPLNATPQEVAEEVAAAWNTLGYEVTVESDDSLTPPRTIVSYPPWITGTTSDGFGAVFSVGENYADFSGYSRCIAPYPGLDDRFPDPTTDQ